jgi:hypothetical protein
MSATIKRVRSNQVVIGLSQMRETNQSRPMAPVQYPPFPPLCVPVRTRSHKLPAAGTSGRPSVQRMLPVDAWCCRTCLHVQLPRGVKAESAHTHMAPVALPREEEGGGGG